MKLAKASENDFKLLWKVFRYMDMLDCGHAFYRYQNTELRQRRLERLIVGRLDQLGTGGFMRVVMGCETLIKNCCDPEADVYAFSPRIAAALEAYDAQFVTSPDSVLNTLYEPDWSGIDVAVDHAVTKLDALKTDIATMCARARLKIEGRYWGSQRGRFVRARVISS